MQNPYVALGIDTGASQAEIRAAYHEKVKRCHPDRVQDKAQQEAAQEVLTQLNLAYAEAMRRASHRRRNAVGIKDAKQAARRLLEQGKPDSALRMLGRDPDRDAEWFAIQGSILLRMGQPDGAHASFRTAIRLDPDSAQYRELALAAGVQMRKQKTLRGRMSGWAKSIVGRML